MGNPKGTKSFSSWSEFTDFVNEMPIKTIQPFVSNFNAFAGEGFYGNVVQGLVIKQVLYSFDSFKSDPYLYRAGVAG